MVTLVEAIKNKFDDFDNCEIPGLIITGSPTKLGSGELCLPHVLVMDSQKIKAVGDKIALTNLTSDIQELDLSDNLLESWEEILCLLQCLPNLSALNLGHNPLYRAPYQWPCDLQSFCFSRLSTLILNATKISWDNLNVLLRVTPNLETLYLCLNDAKQVLPDTPISSQLQNNNCALKSTLQPCQHKGLKNLYFNQNGIEHWAELVCLGELFPNLEYLVAIENMIAEIPPCKSTEESSEDISMEIDEEDESYENGFWSKVFGNLVNLNLSHNLIKDWSSLDNLRVLSNLKEVKVLGLPFYKDWSNESVWNHTIARLPQIKRLNSSNIDPEERETAERDFIRHYMELPENERPQRYNTYITMDFPSSYSRYFELEAIYGKLEKLAHVDLTPPECIKIKVRYGERVKIYNLNPQKTVGEVKNQLCRCFDVVRPSLVRVFYHDQVMVHASGPEELKFNGRMMHSYQVEEGDEIHLLDK